PLVYERLHVMARQQRGRLGAGETLNTTALVHEAYLRLVGQDGAWADRSHFYGTAAKAMRHILIDHARRKTAAKRGGDNVHVPLDDVIVMSEERAGELIVLDEALSKLEAVDPRRSQIVECRFFAGLSIKETAEIMDISTATVSREWRVAKAWLFREMRA
ncbi:MAG: sigma-70 family RNA polymerase sigma factor, partial [Bacteroidota bacterium]